MDFSLTTALLALASGGLIGLVLGLVGGGGSILAVPLLVYVVGVPSAHAGERTRCAGWAPACDVMVEAPQLRLD